MNRNRNDNGVTVVELLVVVMIVVILCALLMPVFTKARRKAKDVICISNLKQIHVALNLYENDCGSYPPNTLAWPGLKPYYPQLLECPSAATELEPAFHYTYYGVSHPIPKTDPETGEVFLKSDLFQKCKDARGAALPIAMDRNHIKVAVYDGNSDPVFILRDGGSVDAIPISSVTTTEGCHPTLLPPFLGW